MLWNSIKSSSFYDLRSASMCLEIMACNKEILAVTESYSFDSIMIR